MSESVIVFLAMKLHIVIVAIAATVLLFVSIRDYVKLFVLSGFALTFSFALGKVASGVVENTRPFVVSDITPLVQHIADNGFPSEHTLLVATIAGLIYLYHKGAGLLLMALSLLVGMGRVLAEVHHTLDVAGSFTIAAASVYTAKPITDYYYSN